jgi:hypothetical protein
MGGNEMYKRLTADEQNAFLRLCAVQSIMDDDTLLPHIALVKRGKSKLGMIRHCVDYLIEGICYTMTTNQLISLKRQLPLLRWRVGVKRPVDTDERDYGWFLSNDDINTLLEGCRDRCMMCSMAGSDVYNCKLRKVLDTMPVEGVQCERMSANG